MLYINIVNKKTSPKRGSVSISPYLLEEPGDDLDLVQVPLNIHRSYQSFLLKVQHMQRLFRMRSLHPRLYCKDQSTRSETNI